MRRVCMRRMRLEINIGRNGAQRIVAAMPAGRDVCERKRLLRAKRGSIGKYRERGGGQSSMSVGSHERIDGLISSSSYFS